MCLIASELIQTLALSNCHNRAHFRRKTDLAISSAGAEDVDFCERVIEIKARASAGVDSQPAVQRHRAMMSGADRNPFAIEQLSDVVGMELVHRETDDARFPTCRGAENSHAADRLQDRVGPFRKRAFVGRDRFHADRLDVVQGRT